MQNGAVEPQTMPLTLSIREIREATPGAAGGVAPVRRPLGHSRCRPCRIPARGQRRSGTWGEVRTYIDHVHVDMTAEGGAWVPASTT